MSEVIKEIKDIKEKIVSIVKNEFDLDISEIDPEGDIIEELGLDSLQFVELYAAVIEELNIEVPVSFMSVKTFNEILKVLYCEIQKQTH
jgi:acyl carrier protein